MKKLLIALLVIIALGLGFYWYIGGFQTLEVKNKKMGGYLVAGLEFTGPYHKVGPAMMKADSILRATGVECTKGFGIYYDNPEEVEADKLRSFVGNIIENADSETIAKIKETGLRVDSIPEKNAIVVEMKTRNNLSYMTGPMKAYPLLHEKQKADNCTPSLAFEIYDVPAHMTYYVMHCE